MQQIETTLKKMGMVLEKLVQKVDEIDNRLKKLEEKVEGNSEKKFTSADLKNNLQNQNQMNSTSKPSSGASLGGSFGSSFLGSLAGAMAGMGLYNLLFNNDVSPEEFGKEMGMSEEEISNLDVSEIDSKLEEITSQLDEIDSKLSEMDSDLASDFDQDLQEGLSEWDSGDDFGGFDDGGDFA